MADNFFRLLVYSGALESEVHCKLISYSDFCSQRFRGVKNFTKTELLFYFT